MRWLADVARVGEKENACRVLVAKSEKIDLLKDTDADEKEI
jgi:hypothetical protein